MNKKTASVLKGAASLMILMYHMQVKNIFTSCGGYFGVGIFYFFSVERFIHAPARALRAR